MIIEYEWVSREPFLEYNSYNVKNWLIQLAAKGWLTESGKIASSGDPEAIAYRSSTVDVPLGGMLLDILLAISHLCQKFLESWKNGTIL